jgi:hypothetical protein
LSEGGNGQEWVLARGLCTYTVLEGAAVPPRKRRAFVAMAVSRWAPFADAQSHVEWVGDRAMVWAWSKAQVLAGPDGTVLPAPRRIWPESMLRGQPAIEGEELVAMDEGVEARAWRDGVMIASRWWMETPDLPEWNEFRRGAGLPPASAVPVLAAHALAERPWAAQKALGLGETFGHYRNYLSVAAAGMVATVLAALLVGVLALKVSNWQLDKDIAKREQALEKVIDARDRAQRAHAAIDAALALRPPAGQVDLLAQVSKLMRGNWQLVEWKLIDAQSLEVTAKMLNADPGAIVTAWEASKRFTDVTAEIGRQPNTVVIKARVLRAPSSAGARK